MLRLLKVAQSKPEWETAYLASVLALNTTMRGYEVKQLRWRDIDLMDQSLVIRRSKTLAGERVIPLNATESLDDLLQPEMHCRSKQRKALDALAVGVKKVGYDTSNDTKQPHGAILSSQVPERNGGDDETRTRDLCRDRAAF